MTECNCALALRLFVDFLYVFANNKCFINLLRIRPFFLKSCIIVLQRGSLLKFKQYMKLDAKIGTSEIRTRDLLYTCHGATKSYGGLKNLNLKQYWKQHCEISQID